ncbi:MAG: N-acetylglutamate synthase or related acetyltransferase [Candidatus Alkanophagales archaeon MCA70_species_1]|nr:N-acetylglutamate synthase or related acetyltransferase [Candidatus Alkanophaga volatiphilum]
MGDIRPLSDRDRMRILNVINEAAKAYKGKIPKDCYSEPYMSSEELEAEMRRMQFYGYYEGGDLVGVFGLQHLLEHDVTLIRHLYVLPTHQRRGIGTHLLKFGIEKAPTNVIYVGTWAAADWAIRLYEKHGFKNLGNDRKLLRKYWDIPESQVESSVVLEYTKKASQEPK